MAAVLKAKPGLTLDGRFLLIEELAQGGMSTIFLAEDLGNRPARVVVKVPLPIFSSGTGAWSIFQREEEIGLALDHPCVLKFVRLDTDLDHKRRRSYVVTEYVEGRTLADLIAERAPLPEREALRIASRLCAAVQHVHDRGFVHYDLKPANVMLGRDGSLRLIDFGLAHAAVSARFVLAGRPPPIGSSDYVAPEQIRRKRGRPSVDIYGIGVIAYEMLTGRAPFPGDDPFAMASARVLGDPPAPRLLQPRISREAEEIVLRALRRDPIERYPSAAAMQAALDRPERVDVSNLCDRLVPVTPGRRRRRIARTVLLVGVLPVAMQVALFLGLWGYLASRR
jgi:serine/threonine-protein kinase